MPRRTRKTTCAETDPAIGIKVCVTRASEPGEVIKGPDDVCRLLKGTASADRESLYAVHLDSANRVLGVEEVAKGTIGSVETTPREIFKSALLTNASAIILAHNHPSGKVEPSASDDQITRQVLEASKILGVPVRDHLIVGTEGCTSIRSRWGEGKGFGRGVTRSRRGGR